MEVENAQTNISVSCTSEYPDYTYNEKHDIWALVSLIAPCQEEDDTNQERAAMDIVAVMDKSGSMAGEKLKLVKRTLEFVLTQLTTKDRLAVVTYDTDVYVDFGLMNMSKENKKKASSKIQNIRDGSCTNLCGGVMKGLCQIINRPAGNKNDVASVLLFTDGLANEGIDNVEGIVAAMKDPKRFDGPEPAPSHRDNPEAPAPHTSWLKNIFSGISGASSPPPPTNEVVDVPSRSDSNSTSSSKGSEATVYTFGFGADHNANMLKRISDAGNGMYYFIETEDKIGESFAHCLGGLMSTVAQGIQLQVTTETGIKIKGVHTTRPYEESGGNNIKVNIGDLQSEEKRDIVLELSLDTVNAPHDTTPQCLLNASVDYFNVVSNNLMSATGSLGVLRPITATVHDNKNVNARLTKERCRVGMTKAMDDAGEKSARGDFDQSRKVLEEQIAVMKACQASLSENAAYDDDMDEEYGAMVNDLEEYQANAVTSEAWQSRGQNLQMNLVQQYNCQRSAMPGAVAFKSKARSRAVDSSKSFFKKK